MTFSSETSLVSEILTPSTPQETKEVREDSPFFKEFCAKLAAFPTPEERIAHALQFMREAISQEGSPRFREFWEARRAALPCFKENLNNAIRSTLWNDYVELTVEARRLKDILEEQSAFAMEQIDLAVQAIEADLGNFEALVQAAPEIVFPEGSPTMQDKAAAFNALQKELNILNAQASRLSALRKEIIRTDMRIRFKTKFFKRLSDLGDKVFPRRKELIETVSGSFATEIDAFIVRYFQGEVVVGAPWFQVREEIKALQASAKYLTLNSSVFTSTRLALSECWDKVKVLEKEHKKEAFEKRQVANGKLDEIKGKIDALAAQNPSFEVLCKELDQISSDMRSTQLLREDVQYLRSEMHKLKAPHFAEQEAKVKALEEAEKEKLRVKREALNGLKERLSTLSLDMDVDALQTIYSQCEKELALIAPSKIDRQQIERSLRHLKDNIAEKKESSLLSLSEDDRRTLDTLQTVLQQKKQRRLEIKEQLEQVRKALGGSGLDFEKAMQYRELLEQEKERLEKANAGIEEVEGKIAALENLSN